MGTLTEKKRIEFIDLAKGVCILMVVVGHTIYFRIPGLNSMRMPLYFILSGLFFKDYGGFINLLLKKINKILVPFLFFYLMGYLLFYLFEWLTPGLIKSDARSILDVFTQRQWFNGPIWFLLALFWANLMFCIVSLNIKKEAIRALIVGCIGVFGAALGKTEVFLPCNIDSAMTAIPFFYFGYLLKKTPLLYPNKYDKFNLLWVMLLYAVSVEIEIAFDNPRLGFHSNFIVGNYFVILCISITSVMAALFLCKIVKGLPFVSYFGRYSIIPLCVHHLIYRPIKLLLAQFNISEGGYVAILTILICWACIPLCIKFIPWFTAQKDLIVLKNK